MCGNVNRVLSSVFVLHFSAGQQHSVTATSRDVLSSATGNQDRIWGWGGGGVPCPREATTWKIYESSTRLDSESEWCSRAWTWARQKPSQLPDFLLTQETHQSVCWRAPRGDGAQTGGVTTVHQRPIHRPRTHVATRSTFTVLTPPSCSLRHTRPVQRWPEVTPSRAGCSLTNYGLRALTAIKTWVLWFV